MPKTVSVPFASPLEDGTIEVLMTVLTRAEFEEALANNPVARAKAYSLYLSSEAASAKQNKKNSLKSGGSAKGRASWKRELY